MKGFTLLELLITMAIACVLLGLAVPGLGSYLEKNRSDVAVAELFTALLFTRNYAVTKVREVELCGSDDGQNCKKHWSKQLIAFIDKNDNGQAEPEEVVRVFQLELEAAHIRSRIAYGKAYTTFKPNGQASFTGSLIYCPNRNNAKNLRRVTWNRVGRAYRGLDRNGDGVIDDTNGRSLAAACP